MTTSRVSITNEGGTKKVTTTTRVLKESLDVSIQNSTLSGASANGSVALAVANTWYQVPNVVPTSDYLLVATIENGSGDIRWSTENGGIPGVSNGNLAPGELSIKLAGNEVLYYSSTIVGDDINWLTKII